MKRMTILSSLILLLILVGSLIVATVSADNVHLPIVVNGEEPPVIETEAPTQTPTPTTTPTPEATPTISPTPQPENFISHVGTFPRNLPSGGHAQLSMGGYSELIDLTYAFGAEEDTLYFDIPADAATLIDFSAANLICQRWEANGLTCRPALESTNGYLWFVSATVRLHDCAFDVSAEKHRRGWWERYDNTIVTTDLVWFNCGGGE